MAGGSSEHLSNKSFQPGVFPYETRFTLALLLDLKGFGHMSQRLVAPLIILGLADLMLVTELGDGLTFQAFDDDHRFGFGVPLTALHG
jgi:hypothetical protein